MTEARNMPVQRMPRQVWDVQGDLSTDAWLITDLGIMARTVDGWQPIALPSNILDIGGPGVLGGAGSVHWIAGGQSGLVRTADAGVSWSLCWLDGVQQLITCIVPAPGFADNGVALAGTLGAGVLRSTDGGRRWLLSNFGLHDFTILALTMAGDWLRREVVFAGTLDGVFRSIGGGRAWKFVGLAGLAIQTLATSKRYAVTGLVLAGSEETGLYRSVDGGRTWQPSGAEIGRTAGINGLRCVATGDSEVWVVGTDAGSLWRSVDGGESWRLAHQADYSVLALATVSEARLYAALGEGGLLSSRDAGLTWEPVFSPVS